MASFERSLLLAFVMLGCGGRSTSTSPSVAPAVPASSTTIVVSAPSLAQPTASATAAPPPVPATPAAVARSGKTWPFHAWDHAEAVTFNQIPMRERVRLYAYDDGGWSPLLVDRKPLTETLAKEAVDLVTRTQGGVDVSKCPFPRHAVVLYEREVPVASINVCFTCGDILVWPDWEPPPDWDKLTDEQRKKQMLRSEKQLKLYEKAFPRWKTFFRDEVGFPIDATYPQTRDTP